MQVFFSDQAFLDMEGVREYFDEVAPHKTNEIILSIVDRVFLLEEYPLSGPEEPFLKSIGLNRRFLVEGNYKIIYRIEDNIYITQVFDARQDPLKMIDNEAK